jgi:erythromycin esterase
VKEAWADWIQRNHAAIRSSDPADTDYSDLRFLLPLLEGRRIVALGESAHGVGDYDAMKVRLIKFLHEEAGFDVIAFESGFYECFRMDEQVGSRSPTDVMKGSIFRIWHASETLPLFEYLQATRETARPLVLAGFDNQISSDSGVADRPALYQEALGQFAPDLAAQVQQADREVLAHALEGETKLGAFFETDGERLKATYEAATAAFDERRQALAQAYADRPLLPLVLRHSAWSMPRYMDMIRSGTTNHSREIRDEAMAATVDALLDTLYPGKKIILWAHNAHIQHDGKPVYGFKNMGRWLSDRRGDEIYAVGLMMRQGQAARNDRTVYTLAPVLADSAEAVMSRAGQPIAFVDLLHQERVDGNGWMFEMLAFKDWGMNDLAEVPRDQLDAILYIDTVHPPHYL